MPNGSYTTEEIGARIRQRNPQALQGFTDVQIGERAVKRNPQLQAIATPVSQEQAPAGPTGAAGVVSGAAKTYVDTPRQFSQSGASIGKAVTDSPFGQFFLNNITKPIVNLFSDSTKQKLGNAANAAASVLNTSIKQPEILKRNTEAEKIGETAANVSQFLLPGAGAAKAARVVEEIPLLARFGKFAKPLARAGTEGIASTAISAGQTGDIGTALGTGATDAVITGGLGVLGQGLKGLRKVAPQVAEATPSLLSRGANTAKETTGGFIKTLPERAINNILRPPSKAFSFGKNPGKAVADLGIIGNSEEEFLQNIATKRNDIGEQIGGVMRVLDQTPNISVSNVLKPLDEAIEKSTKFKRTNQPLVTRLEALRDDLTDVVAKAESITPQQAFDIKKELGAMAKWTGQAFDGDLNQVRVGIYSNLKKAIEKAAEGKSGTLGKDAMSLRKLNELYGNLVEAESALQNRIAVSQRNNMVSLRDVGIAGAGAMLAGGPAGITVAILDRIGGTVAVRTRLASRLSAALKKMAPEEIKALEDSIPIVSKALEGLPPRDQEKFIESLPIIAKLLRMGLFTAVGSDTPQSQRIPPEEVPQQITQ